MVRINVIGESMFQPEPQVTDKKNFPGKVCLCIRNLSQDVTEEEIRILLEEYGEVTKCELRLEKAYAIVEMDCATDVEKIKYELNDIWFKGRQLEILDAHAIRMKKLRSWIPKEIFEKAFDSSIGDIKYTIVFVNKKSHVTEGIIKFQTKKSAQLALNCSRKCYISMTDPRPVNVKSVEQNNANDMFGNKNLPRKTPKFCTAYKKPVEPHFAHFAQSRIMCKYSKKYSKKWNRLEEKYERKNEELERELTMEKEKLEDQLERELEKIFLSKQKRVIALQKQMIMKALQNKE